MPQIGTITPACWLDYLPASPRDQWASYREQIGMADQTTLFFPSVYPEVPLRMVLTGSSVADCDNKLRGLRDLRQTKPLCDDGLRRLPNCLVLGIMASPAVFSPVIVGGSSAGDTYEMEVVVIVQPPSPDLA